MYRAGDGWSEKERLPKGGCAAKIPGLLLHSIGWSSVEGIVYAKPAVSACVKACGLQAIRRIQKERRPFHRLDTTWKHCCGGARWLKEAPRSISSFCVQFSLPQCTQLGQASIDYGLADL